MRTRTLAGQSLVVVFTALLLWGGASSRAEACSCLQPTVESSYNQSTDVVIVAMGWQLAIGDTRYYFARVQRTFKGCLDAGDWVILTTPVSSASCGAVLNARRHLVNGSSAGTQFGLPVLSINLCSYNQAVADLTEHDNAFLDGRYVCCGDACACASGEPMVRCFADPCQVAPDCAESKCTANYCGGCNAEFYDANGYAVCQGEDRGCVTDEDCAAGQWCQEQSGASSAEARYECVPFVGEGESCGGFRPAWTFERCAEGLICDPPDFIADAPGICRASCNLAGDCKAGSYCASDKLCDQVGACERDVDCNLTGNSYPHIECVGYGVCEDASQCGWQCGDPQCLDLSGVDFGPCDAVLGWGVHDGSCTQLSGCGSDFPLFATEAACARTCP